MSYTVYDPIQTSLDPDLFAPLAGGTVYFGVPNGNPQAVVGDRVQVYLARQGLADLAISQPVSIGPGGQWYYNGNPAQIKILVPYCVQVFNSLGVQEYYAPSAGDEVTKFNAIDAELAVTVKTVDTYADLSAALSSATIGQQLSLLGHTVAGIGGGIFDVVSSSGLVADNGTTVVNGAKAAVRVSKGYVTPQDFGAIPGTDCTAAVQAAFGGAGTTPNNTHVRVPADDSDYLISAPIKIYRTGDLLEHVSLRCEKGAKFTQTVNSKGFVFGEPNAADGLWGAGVGITAKDITVEGLTHEFDDMGLWFVGCEDVVAKDIGGYKLVVVAVGNDSVDDCKNVKVINPTRLGDGRNVSPDAWYTVGIYRTTGFEVSGLFSRFLPAAAGTGGNHVIVAESHNGQIYGADIKQTTASGNGINVEVGSTNIRVYGNGVQKCASGIVTFGAGNEDNLIALNDIKDCGKGIDVQAPGSRFFGNVISGSTIADIYNANIDAIFNTFQNNTYSTLIFDPTIIGFQYFIGNQGSRSRIFIPAIDFKQYLPAGVQETLDSTTLRATNAAGSIRFVAKLETGGRCGDVKNVVFHFNRLIAATAVNCYVNLLTSTGSNIAKGEVLDVSVPTAITSATVVMYSGTSFPVSKDNCGIAIFIPTVASLAELIGVSFDFIETGLDSVVAS